FNAPSFRKSARTAVQSLACLSQGSVQVCRPITPQPALRAGQCETFDFALPCPKQNGASTHFQVLRGFSGSEPFPCRGLLLLVGHSCLIHRGANGAKSNCYDIDPEHS